MSSSSCVLINEHLQPFSDFNIPGLLYTASRIKDANLKILIENMLNTIQSEIPSFNETSSKPNSDNTVQNFIVTVDALLTKADTEIDKISPPIIRTDRNLYENIINRLKERLETHRISEKPAAPTQTEDNSLWLKHALLLNQNLLESNADQIKTAFYDLLKQIDGITVLKTQKHKIYILCATQFFPHCHWIDSFITTLISHLNKAGFYSIKSANNITPPGIDPHAYFKKEIENAEQVLIMGTEDLFKVNSSCWIGYQLNQLRSKQNLDTEKHIIPILINGDLDTSPTEIKQIGTWINWKNNTNTYFYYLLNLIQQLCPGLDKSKLDKSVDEFLKKLPNFQNILKTGYPEDYVKRDLINQKTRAEENKIYLDNTAKELFANMRPSF